MLEYFVREAGEYLERLGAIARSPAGPGAEGTEFVRLTRALRGSALMAKQAALAHAAQGLEALARAVVEGHRAWDEPVRRTVIRAVEECRGLVGRVGRPAPGDEGRAFRLGSELERLAARAGAEAAAPRAVRPSRAGAPEAAAVSVESLFHDDAGPHLLGDLAESFTSYAQLVARYGVPPGSLEELLSGPTRAPGAPRIVPIESLAPAQAPASAERPVVPIASLLYSGDGALRAVLGLKDELLGELAALSAAEQRPGGAAASGAGRSDRLAALVREVLDLVQLAHLRG